MHIIIAGAGLAGPLLAVFLARRGHRITLYEARNDPREKGYSGGRSINLALSARGIDALQRVGLATRVCAEAIRMPGRMLHDPTGATVFQPYSANPADAINSVSRGGLNITNEAVRGQIAAAVGMIVQVNRLSDGQRKVTHVTEITGMEGQVVQMQDIFLYHRTSTAADGKVIWACTTPNTAIHKYMPAECRH